MKEEYAIILDFLPHGYPTEMKRLPIAQALGTKFFTLLELVPRRGVVLEIGEKVYIGPEKRDKVYFIRGKLLREKLTEMAKKTIQEVVPKLVEENKEKFVDFFNKAEAVSTRLHQLELLPGLGKKYMDEILKEREKKSFQSFEEIRKRIRNIPDPKKIIERRIIEELIQKTRHKLFTH